MHNHLTFEQFFGIALSRAGSTSSLSIHPWQKNLADEHVIKNRLIRVPTGLGKTAGVVLAWLWNRVQLQNDAWPRRLVFTLPMRTLVEQTHREVLEWLRHHALLWTPSQPRAGKVAVHLLMGGADRTDWNQDVEHEAILIGTQDMLLSRALNRGYAASRARWPTELGLLSQDCLWILDEVQLMDVGLSTSAQLQQFRDDATRQQSALRPSYSWWMSATLQPDWLASVDTGPLLNQLGTPLTVPPDQRTGHAWSAQKSLTLVDAADPKEFALQTWKAHQALGGPGQPRLTLLVVNTVERALKCFDELTVLMKKDPGQKNPSHGPTLKVIHSRFRPQERSQWVQEFLNKDACNSDTLNLILVATQVVEAGVDISARALLTELAPWSSLVQRFGRAARFGGQAAVTVLNPGPKDDRQAAPYTLTSLEAALKLACSSLPDVSMKALEDFEAGLASADRATLYPYTPQTLLLQQEWLELFDTTPDLTGADLDVSRFIRSGDERDVQVFWREAGDKTPSSEFSPAREELCAVPFLKAREWLCGSGEGSSLLKTKRAWVWDFVEGEWRAARRPDIFPGRVLLVDAESGGYSLERGWSPESSTPVEPVPTALAELDSDRSNQDDVRSEYPYKTLSLHSREVADEARSIAQALQLPIPLERLLVIAARWHDLGKAHPAFQGSIRAASRPNRSDLAKAPGKRRKAAVQLPAALPSTAAETPEVDAWPRSARSRFWTLPQAHWPRPWEEPGEGASPVSRATATQEFRPGFRHELASMLGLFAVLQQRQPDHPALVGEWRAVLDALNPGGVTPTATQSLEPPSVLEQELLALTPDEFDLVAYLVVSHHGKVRTSLHAAPDDQAYRDRDGRGTPIRGVREGDELPSIQLSGEQPLPRLRLTLAPAHLGLSSLTGRSWTERTSALLKRFGPGTLAFLEACLRAADSRASRLDTLDPALQANMEPI